MIQLVYTQHYTPHAQSTKAKYTNLEMAQKAQWISTLTTGAKLRGMYDTKASPYTERRPHSRNLNEAAYKQKRIANASRPHTPCMLH